MTPVQTEPTYQGIPPEQTPPHIRALFTWADETVAKAPQFLNDGLRHASTLCAALLGGSAVLMDKIKAPDLCKASAVVCLVAALCAAALGGLPYFPRMNINNSDSIEKARCRGVLVKRWALLVANVGLVVGLVIMLCGVLWAGAAP